MWKSRVAKTLKKGRTLKVGSHGAGEDAPDKDSSWDVDCHPHVYAQLPENGETRMAGDIVAAFMELRIGPGDMLSLSKRG